MIKICVSIQAITMNQIIESMSKTETADLVEIRLDYRKEQLNLNAIRSCSSKLLIATNRRKDQGGKAKEPETARIQLLRDAVEAGFDYVDLGYNSKGLMKIVPDLQNLGIKVIVSYHDFEYPLNLQQIVNKYNEVSKTKCDIIKIIGWTYSFEDNLPYLEFNKRYPGNISFGMGVLGSPSRILAPLVGAAFTYASLDIGQELAPGQVPLKALEETYRMINK